MVNTNDFRRYSYTYDAAYAVDAFNQTRSSAKHPMFAGEKKKSASSPSAPTQSLKAVKKLRQTKNARFYRQSKFAL